jgi:transposase-like protein
MSVRKRYTAEFKARVALEALKGIRTCNEIAGDHGIHPVQVSQWKKDAAEGLATSSRAPRPRRTLNRRRWRSGFTSRSASSRWSLTG